MPDLASEKIPHANHNARPNTGTDEMVSQKLERMHFKAAGNDGAYGTDACQHGSDENREFSVFIKNFLGFVYSFLRQEELVAMMV